MLRRILVVSALVLAPSLFAQTGSVSAAPPVVAAPTPVMSGMVTPIPFPTDTQDAEYARRAGTQALEDWVAGFLTRGVVARRFAVLPLGRDIDGDYFTLQLRNAFANHAHGTDYSLYTRDDDTWKSLVAEIRKGDQFGDTMDVATIQKFGRVQGVQGIIVGRLSGIYAVAGDVGGGAVQLAGEKRGIQVRVLLQAYEVETGRLLWGAEKMGLAMLPDDALVIPGTRRQWMIYGALGLLGLFALSFIFSRLKSAHRPR